MAVYLTEGGEPGQCMRVATSMTDYCCPRKAERRCDDLELCAEHAAEWLANQKGRSKYTYGMLPVELADE